MKKLSTLTLAIFLTVINLANSAHALIDVPTLRLALGPSMINYSAGTAVSVSTPLKSIITLNPMFLWDIPSVRSRLGVHFLADMGSPYGFISTAGVGATAIFYPLGLSSSREVRDDFAEVVKTRISPYFQFSLTPMKFTITQVPTNVLPNTDKSLFPYLNSRVLEYSMGLGLDYPVANDLIVFGGLHYRSAAFTADESTQGAITYSGFSLLVGIMTNFY